MGKILIKLNDQIQCLNCEKKITINKITDNYKFQLCTSCYNTSKIWYASLKDLDKEAPLKEYYTFIINKDGNEYLILSCRKDYDESKKLQIMYNEKWKSINNTIFTFPNNNRNYYVFIQEK